MSESLPLPPPSQEFDNPLVPRVDKELQGALKVAQIPARTAKTTKEVVARVQQGLDALFWGVRRNSEETLQALGAFTAIALTLGGLADGKTERTIAEGEIRIEQGDARAFDCHVGSRAHRQPHVRSGKRRGVIDAVAGHRDLGTTRFQLADDARLVFGPQIGAHVV